MHCSRLAIVAAMTGGLFAAAAFGDITSRALAASHSATGSPDAYYVADQSTPTAPNPPAASAPAAPESNAPAVGCSSCTDCGCTGGSSNSCGCETCCDCNGCCHEKLPHWIQLDCKIHPWLCWDDSCPLTCPDVTTCHLLGDNCWLKEHDTTLTGWIDGGIMGNTFSPATHFNGPVTFTDRDEGQLNQFYGVLQRTPADMSKNCGLFIGGDIDFMWGSDYFFTTAAGLDGTKRGNVPRWYSDPNRLYGSAMPQAYVETDYDDLKIKWGHFYTIIGYEVVPSISNFFYTHSYTMQYGEPFTHTGMLASRNINDNWSWRRGRRLRLERLRHGRRRPIPRRHHLHRQGVRQPGVFGRVGQ